MSDLLTPEEALYVLESPAFNASHPDFVDMVVDIFAAYANGALVRVSGNVRDHSEPCKHEAVELVWRHYGHFYPASDTGTDWCPGGRLIG